MKYEVVALRRADADVRHFTHWIADRSPQGALAWLDAYEQLLLRLAEHADSHSAALESAPRIAAAFLSRFCRLRWRRPATSGSGARGFRHFVGGPRWTTSANSLEGRWFHSVAAAGVPVFSDIIGSFCRWALRQTPENRGCGVDCR
jgi:plasmid stabilization system protein ParE